MSDRDLLEAAARAAGIDHPGGEHSIHDDGRLWDCNALKWWRPLADDGDALRLAVKLRLEIDIHNTGIAVRTSNGCKILINAEDGGDAYAATRRAIVRAAAQMAQEKT